MLTFLTIWLDINYEKINPSVLYIGTVLIDLNIIDIFL
jgi:hypothetical protein